VQAAFKEIMIASNFVIDKSFNVVGSEITALF